ncbi:MAG: flagellin lysine-N-methylase [Eubacteriales bacterium]
MVPDYYKNFSCKCGECTDVCCHGWGITLTFPEYCRMIGLNCKKTLKRKLDRAFYIAEYPTNERYALVNEDENGYCPLIDSEGYCALQRACGEDVLPIVCRMYPRSIKKGEPMELSLSASCERTVELLMESTDKLSFEEAYISLPEGVGVGVIKQTEETISLRRELCKKMEEREKPFSVRLFGIGKTLSGNDNDSTTHPAPINPEGKEISFAVRLILSFSHLSDAVASCADTAMKCLEMTPENIADASFADSAAKRYSDLREHFYLKFPDADIYIEKLMVNHMFYEQFPYVDFNEGEKDAFFSLCAVYVMLKFILVLYTADKNEKSDFVRAASRVFRFIEHTNFYRSAVILIKKEGYNDIPSLFPLMCI